MARLQRREVLVDSALGMFERHGFHAAGIDRILARAGVAKMTLYKNFASKDGLILAALRRRDERMRAWLARGVEARARDPGARLLALFDVLDEWFASDDFCGCLFVRAAGEFTDPGHPARGVASEHKRLLEAYVRKLATRAGAKDPDRLARRLMLLIEGAAARALVSGGADIARDAKAAAEIFVRGEGIAFSSPGA
jgi:AcrR family transcriptional regulator